jgi:hypothetical protein
VASTVVRREAVVLLLLCLPSACDRAQWTEPRPATSAVVCGIDLSGSIRQGLRSAVRQVCIDELDKLVAGWVEVRAVASESYRNEALISRLEQDTMSCANPFSSRCRHRMNREQAGLLEARQRAVERILAAPPSLPGATDLFGFLAAASELLSADTLATRKRIVLASDLEDTAHRTAELDLRGIEIEIWMQLPPNPAEAEKRRAVFVETLTSAGARYVRFRPLRSRPQP